MTAKLCKGCGAVLKPDSKFCTSCGITLEPVEAKTGLSTVGGLFGQNVLASTSAGEMSFTQALGDGTELGPLKYLFSGLGRVFKGMRDVLKNKKQGKFVFALSLIWFVLLLLPALGVNSSALSLLNFLTFAQGGVGGGLFSMVGGIIGKGVLANFLVALVWPLVRGKLPSGLGKSIKSLFGAFNFKNQRGLALTLLGTGFALFTYSFLTGNATWQNSMVGIAAFFLSLQALSRQTGFLRGFLLSLLKKAGLAVDLATMQVSNLMSGWAIGFALGVGLSVLQIGTISNQAGFVLVLVAVVLRIIGARKVR